MHYTIERLIAGDATVVEHYKRAAEKWQEFFTGQPDATASDIATWVTDKQFWFEQNCGGRWPGQEVMAWAGFGALYTTQNGFEDNQAMAEKLRDGFAGSMVSLEVKGAAEDASASYLS